MSIIRFLFIVLICPAALTIARADDGAFYARGDHLFPIRETRVQLKKEILTLKREKEYMTITIYFEFYNPDEEKDVLTGFVTPPGDGDTGGDEGGHPQIKKFTVTVNDVPCRWKVRQLGRTEFKPLLKKNNARDFVYYFTTHFRHGNNIIRHSYQYQAENLLMCTGYPYRLTTGTMWANGEIEDFELNIDMGNDVYFSLPAMFDSKNSVAWNITGKGKTGLYYLDGPPDTTLQGLDSVEERVYIKNGRIGCHLLHFRPERDLYITLHENYYDTRPGAYNRMYRPANGYNDSLEAKYTQVAFGYGFWYDPQTADTFALDQLSMRDLWLLKNYLFAKHGYVFTNPELQSYFSSCLWYMPDEPADSSVVPGHSTTAYDLLTSDEREVYHQLVEEEKRRKQ